MRNYILHVVILLPALLFPIMMPAADLPTLPVASQIRTGVLDNGVAFYLVTNHTEKGKADVALVQKGGFGWGGAPPPRRIVCRTCDGLIDNAATFPHEHSVQFPFRQLYLAGERRLCRCV